MSALRRHVATALTGLVASGIGYVGVSYLRAPEETAPAFGMASWPQGEAARFLAVKGSRDLVSGLVPLLLLATGQRRALGGVLAVEALVPASDAVVILTTGGSTAKALGVHALTAVLVLGTGLLLLTEPEVRGSSRPRRSRRARPAVPARRPAP